MVKNIIQAIFFLIAAPHRGWRRVADRDVEQQDFISNFLFPVFGFIAIPAFVGGMWLTDNGGIHWGLKQVIILVSALFGGFYLVSYLLNELFPRFGLVKQLHVAQLFVGYSSVVVYLLFFLMPLLHGTGYLWFAAIYTLYVVYAGAEVFLCVTANKKLSVTVIASLLIVVVPVGLSLLLKSLMTILPG
jgi:hypothetical protein